MQSLVGAGVSVERDGPASRSSCPLELVIEDASRRHASPLCALRQHRQRNVYQSNDSQIRLYFTRRRPSPSQRADAAAAAAARHRGHTPPPPRRQHHRAAFIVKLEGHSQAVHVRLSLFHPKVLARHRAIQQNTRNAWQSLACSPPGIVK